MHNQLPVLVLGKIRRGRQKTDLPGSAVPLRENILKKGKPGFIRAGKRCQNGHVAPDLGHLAHHGRGLQPAFPAGIVFGKDESPGPDLQGIAAGRIRWLQILHKIEFWEQKFAAVMHTHPD